MPPVYIYAEHCRLLIDFCPSWHLRMKQIPVPRPAMTITMTWQLTTHNTGVFLDTFLDTDFAKRAKKLTEVDTNSEKMHKYFLSHSFEEILAAVWPHTVGHDASVVLICWLSMCGQWGQGYDGLVPVSPVYGCGYWGHNSNDLSLIWPLSGDLG